MLLKTNKFPPRPSAFKTVLYSVVPLCCSEILLEPNNAFDFLLLQSLIFFFNMQVLFFWGKKAALFLWVWRCFFYFHWWFALFLLDVDSSCWKCFFQDFYEEIRCCFWKKEELDKSGFSSISEATINHFIFCSVSD